MSGDSEVPTAHLLGAGMSAIVQAIPALERATGRPVVVVGGLAVLCRLSRPHRATTDLDTVARIHAGESGQIELLVAAGAALSGPTGVQLATAFGPAQIDVLEVTDADLDPLPDDSTDRLHVLSHAWAVETASDVAIVVDAQPPVRVLVAQPAALVAMKLQSAMNRGTAKEGTDLLDIVRLSTDPVCSRAVSDGLQRAGQQLKDDAAQHARRWFEQGRDRTLKRIWNIPEGAGTNAEDLDLVAELLNAALAR